jgi:phenylpropionate dioxygenase-like ring-hydroxylating dioxygenase large terminal subunit
MDRQPDPFEAHRTLARQTGVGSASVDTARYTSPDVYAAECDRIFRRTWLLVARESEIPGPGDFIKREIPPLQAEAVIVRGKDGVVRAFHNACAHRGSALVRATEGTTSTFVCPYHAWSYGTDGRCRAIPGAEHFPQVDRSTIGLPPIHAEIWNGWIFLNFDETPRQSLAEYLGEFGELYADVPFHEFGHAVEIVQDIDTNWKCFLDSFFEGYHVGVLHKQSLPMVPSDDNLLNVYYDTRYLPPHSSLIIQSNPHWIPEGEVLKFVYSSTGATMLRSLEGESAPRETKLTSCKGVNPIGLPKFGLRVLYAFPFTQILIFEDRFMVHQFWPLGLDRTRFAIRFYFRKPPASRLEQFAEAHMMASTRDVLSEDVGMTRLQQIGLRGGGLKEIHFGENELAIRFTHDAIQAYLEGRDPAAR